MQPFMERIILHLIGLLAAASTLAADPPWQRVFNVGFRVVCEADIKNVAVQ